MTATTLSKDYTFPDLIDATVVPRPTQRLTPDPFVSDYVIPMPIVSESPDVTRKLNDLVRWSGWSNRVLGLIIGVSHPTVAHALAGRAGALSRREDAVRRLDAAYDVVERIYILASHKKGRVAEVMETADRNDMTAIKHLTVGNVADAYLTVLRALRPPRSKGMMVGRYPMDPRIASAAVYDED